MGFWNLLGLEGKLDEAGKGYIPSPLSQALAVESKTSYKAVDFGESKKYDGPKKILVVCTEERYMVMANDKSFSTGNHPVETALPLMHISNAGFTFDIATSTGKSVCMEEWAMPAKDEVFLNYFEKEVRPKLDKPLSLKDVVADEKAMDGYVLAFIPGGHGAMLGLPEDENLSKLIKYIKTNDKYLMSICHGPAAFLSVNDKDEPHPYAGYEMACFPDATDKQTPMIGYIPGPMPWFFGEKLTERGLKIMNKNPDGTVIVDRKLLTGASPKAGQELGVVTAQTLLKEYAA